MEPLSNIGLRCEKHKSYPDQTYFDKPFEFFVGKYCKLAFITSTGQNELMWVKVEGIKEIEGTKYLVGVLDNTPIIVTEYRDGDGVAFERHEIHVVICQGD